MKLGIIGTAGRGEDGEKLKLGHWILMQSVAQTFCRLLEPEELVSGGAAIADHLAVNLYLSGDFPGLGLTLHLPTEFKNGKFVETFLAYDTGQTANHYHRIFSSKFGLNSLDEIDAAIRAGAKTTIGKNNFKARNTLVANDSDVLLAFTFGNGPELKDGGTKDTMDKFLKKIEKMKEDAYNCNMNGRIYDGPNYRAFHFDLNSKKLYEL